MFTSKKLNTYKIQLNEKEDTILDEICEYSGLTKSDAISRALKYYYDDQCPCSTDRKDILVRPLKKAISMALNFLFLFRIYLYPKTGTLLTQVIGKILMLKLPYDWQSK